jgi:apolipoprotein D and lipocalin family protein
MGTGMKLKMKILTLVSLLLLSGCVGKPDGIEPVKNFSLDKYLGKWYEIARLDHSFERGLSRVTANYSLQSDGGVKVVNRGFSSEKNRWKEAEGKAYFVESPDQGYLKVSFFGPFYGSYIVFELDQDNYRYAMITGPDKSYLWILSRTPTIPDNLRDRLLKIAVDRGFDTAGLIFVEQSDR